MFKKYSSIENSYRQKHIEKVLSWYPEVANMKYSIREKIDGSNLQLYFEPGAQMKVGKRSKFLDEGENFFEVWDTLNKYIEETSILQNIADTNGCTIRVFGEIYGQGVQKRVKYGEEKYYAIFDIELDGALVTQEELETFCGDHKLDHLLVPLLGYADSLVEALQFNVDFDSKVLGIENNPSEGVVIKPYDKEIVLGNGSRFILKKKSDAFSDKMSIKPGSKKAEEASHVIQAKAVFQGYINENRIKDLFSKHGELEDMSQFGQYIKLTIEDAKEDFLKDFDTSHLDEKELKNVFKSGGKQAALLLRTLT